MCLCVYLSLCACVCMHVHVCANVCLNMCTCGYVHMWVCMNVSVCVYMSICICVSMCAYACLDTHTHVCKPECAWPVCICMRVCVHVPTCVCQWACVCILSPSSSPSSSASVYLPPLKLITVPVGQTQINHQCVCVSCSVTAWLQPARLLCPWNFPGKNTRVGCHALLQRIFPPQGSNPGLLHCRQILYPLNHHGSPNHQWILFILPPNICREPTMPSPPGTVLGPEAKAGK